MSSTALADPLRHAYANARLRVTRAQIDNVRRQLAHQRQISASDVADTNRVLQHYETATGGSVLLHQHYRPKTDSAPEQPLVIIIADRLQRALLHAHGSRLVHMDAKHGTNPHGYPLYSLSVSDEHGKGVPGAFMITSSESADTVKLFLETVKQKIREDFAEQDSEPFQFSHAMIDKSKAEIAACNELNIFYVLCYFHVLQELQRFLRSSESGVTAKADHQRIICEIEACTTRRLFLQRSADFERNNAAFPLVVVR